MREPRFNTQKILKGIYRLVYGIAFFLALTAGVILFLKVKYYVTADGHVETSIEIPLKPRVDGKIEGTYIRDGREVLPHQILLKVKDAEGRDHAIDAPIPGKFIGADDEDLKSGKQIEKDGIFGFLTDNGCFFKALVNDKDIFDVRAGQDCLVRIWGLDKRYYPPVPGRVVFVSDVPVYDRAKTYYPVYCVLNDDDGSVMSVMRPGISGRAKILIGRYTLLESLLGDRKIQNE